MSRLLELSHELLHCIFTEVKPSDLASLRATCQTFNTYIPGNRLLHKELYSLQYDRRVPEAERDWETILHDLVKLEKMLRSDDVDVKRDHREFVSEQIAILVSTARTDSKSSKNISVLLEYFKDSLNVDTFLCASSLFLRGGTDMQQCAATTEGCQASAKLHCLYGKPVDKTKQFHHTPYYHSPFLNLRQFDANSRPAFNTRNRQRGLPVHTVARSRVYDLRQYTDGSLWGPFHADGSQRVDWEKVEAIMIVLNFNLDKFAENSGARAPFSGRMPLAGAVPRSYTSPAIRSDDTNDQTMEAAGVKALKPELEARDPYGVTGTWMRIVCFLDYNDLYAFNFSGATPPPDEPREPIDTEEGIIDLEESLYVTRIEPPGTEEDVDAGDGLDWSGFKGERLPVVHFRGISRSLHASWDPNANSRIRGTVRQTPEGEIRWTTFSIFQGEERWRSEGIQIGGPKSARGILSNWFDKDFDALGPAGPTAFWKVTDELIDEKAQSAHVTWI